MKKKVIFASVFFIVIIVIIGVYSNVFSKSMILMTVKHKYTMKNYAPLYNQPILRNQVYYDNIKNNEKYFQSKDIKFKVPWRNIEKVYDEKESYRIKFTDNKFVVIYNSSENWPDKLNKLLQSEEDRKRALKVLGADVLENEYNLKKCIFESNPSKISFFRSYDEVVLESVLVALKDMSMTMFNASKIIEFNTEKIKGFQYGEVPNNKNNYIIDFYDKSGIAYMLQVKGTGITQNDIDYILTSIDFND